MDEMTYRRGPVTVAAKWDDGRLVDLHITADKGDGIGHGDLQRALMHIEADLRADRGGRPVPAPPTPEEREARKERRKEWDAVATVLAEAFQRGGKSSDIYLATLARAYEVLAKVKNADTVKWQAIGTAIDRSPNTAKMHLVEARRSGFLSEFGEMTSKAKAVFAKKG
ncbi:hypothetical protein ACYSUO_25715 [Streptomyces sp. UC4497]